MWSYICTHVHTHTAVDDYVIDPVTVIVPPGDGGNILVQIPIIDDVIAEETEQVFVGVLSFAGDSNGATLGRNATKLIITDDDGKLSDTFFVHEPFMHTL